MIAWSYFIMISRSIGWAKGEMAFAEMSNEWAVAPSKTTDRSTVLLGDPHLSWQGMNRWYEAHLIGDRLSVYGATFYGCPFIIIGHNGRIA